MKTLISLFVLSILWTVDADIKYHKEYFDNQVLKAEGWMENGEKVKYWKFYRPNGRIKSEGHFAADKKCKYWFFYQANGEKLKEGSFANDLMVDWWTHYDKDGKIIEKCQYDKGVKNGYRVLYVKEKPKMVEKFEDNVKTDEWTSFTGFIIENGDLLLDE